MSALPSGVQYLTRAAAGQLDSDAHETREWLEAFDAIVQREGKDRAQYLFDRLADHAVLRGVQSARARVTPYCNSIPLAQQPHYPGDEAAEAVESDPAVRKKLEELRRQQP